MNLEKLRDTLKDRVTLICLSFLFFMGTTIISVMIVYLPSWMYPEKYQVFNLGSTVVGSFMGQVTLLIAMSLISAIYGKDMDQKVIEHIQDLRTEEIDILLKRITDLEGPELKE